MRTYSVRTRYLGVLVVLLIAAGLAAPIQAQEGGFSETFDNPSLPDWEHSPNASVVGGVLRIDPGGFAFRGGRWADLTLALRARRTGEGLLEVLYRSTDTGAYVFAFGNEFSSLRRESAGASTELARAPVPTPPGAWVQIGVTLTGNTHTLTLDGQTVLTATDPDPLPPGGLMLRGESGATGEFDDVSLTVAGETLVGTAAPPGTIPDASTLTWVRTGGPPGGLGYDIRYNFNDHNVWYVTDAWAGLHMSTDDGLTWFASNEGITTRVGAGAADAIPIFSATVDPHNPNIIWIGTQNSGAILKSTDGGYTWVEKDNGIQRGNFVSFRGFTVDPRTSDIVYVMGEIGSPGWTPDGSQQRGIETDKVQGIVYKTTDGGEHWTQIWRGDNLARYLWIDPRNPDVLYVSTGIFDREAANSDAAAGFAGGVGILKSTDGGATWRVLNQQNGLLDLYVGSLYMHPTNPDVLLAAASQNNWSFYGGREFTGGVFLTEDGGERWERVVATGELFSAVEFCTSDPNVAYAGSIRAIYRSDDGGHTWQRFGRPDGRWGPAGVIAGFPIDMQCDPDDPTRIFVNNYLGGNFLSTDGGQTWISVSRGYTGAQMRQVAVAEESSWTVYAGGRSGIFRSDDGGGEWRGLAYPPADVSAALNEIIALAVDPGDASRLLAAPIDLRGMLFSDDGGQSWRKASGLSAPPTRLIFAPSDPAIAYAAVTPIECVELLPGMPPCDSSRTALYRSQDGGESWSKLADGIAALTLAVHPSDPNTVYAGTRDAGVLKTTDGGKNWMPTGAGLSLPVRSLAIVSSQPQIIYAGSAGGGVYRSDNLGLSWSQTSAGLNPESIITGLAVDPTNTQVIYAADWRSGVYVSADGGATWKALNDGLTHRTVNALALSKDGTVLYAAVEGDGVYRLGTPAALPPATQVPATPTSAPGATEPAPAGATQPAAQVPTATPQPSGGFQLPCLGGAAILPLAVVRWACWKRRR